MKGGVNLSTNQPARRTLNAWPVVTDVTWHGLCVDHIDVPLPKTACFGVQEFQNVQYEFMKRCNVCSRIFG